MTLTEELEEMNRRREAEELQRRVGYGAVARGEGVRGTVGDPSNPEADLGAELNRKMYEEARRLGYSPETANTLVESGTRQNFESLPMKRGEDRYTPPQPSGPTNPTWSAEEQARGLRQALEISAGQGLETRVNQMNQQAAGRAMDATQALRDRAGQGMTNEERERRGSLRAALDERREVREYRSVENARDRESAERVAELENPAPAGPQVTDLGNGRKVVTHNGQMAVVDDKGNQVGSARLQDNGSYIVTQPDGTIGVEFPPGANVDPMVAVMASRLAGELSDPKLEPEELRRKQAELEALLNPESARRENGGGARGGDRPPQVSTRAEYDRLPSGTEYIDPKGRTRRKP